LAFLIPNRCQFLLPRLPNLFPALDETPPGDFSFSGIAGFPNLSPVPQFVSQRAELFSDQLTPVIGFTNVLFFPAGLPVFFRFGPVDPLAATFGSSSGPHSFLPLVAGFPGTFALTITPPHRALFLAPYGVNFFGFALPDFYCFNEFFRPLPVLLLAIVAP